MVAWHISYCITCQKLKGMVEEQTMADLPPDRSEPASFTFSAVDYFGPEGRREVKRIWCVVHLYGIKNCTLRKCQLAGHSILY